MKNTIHKINNLSRNKKISLSVVAAALIAGGLFVGCGGGDSTTTSTTLQPLTPDPTITSTALVCDGVFDITASVADNNESNVTVAVNVSGKTDSGSDSALWRQSPNAANTLVRMMGVVCDAKTAGGAEANGTIEPKVHPMLISYAEQVIGDYELGDGSADVGDPTHVDEIFASLSRDDGQTWKKYQISESTGKWSKQVQWDTNDDNVTELTNYPGHNIKPTMAAYGNRILVAWHSKYCPSGNPFDLNSTILTDGSTSYPTDYFKINGNQESIDYAGVVFEPNGKTVWEVPFSCIWVARGIFDANASDANDTNGTITWTKPEQLTAGVRDAMKVAISASKDGFALTWQEDVEGLREGKGAGPGEGWSGSTTNHGSDIWYSMITKDDFYKNDGATLTKPTATAAFSYPVRITDNELCKASNGAIDPTESKLYCKVMCDTFGTAKVTDSTGAVVGEYCKTGDVDALVDQYAVLNGDTGASRPLIKIMDTDTGPLVVLGYEETKGLSENGTETKETPVELVGKSVYYEIFPFKKLEMPTTEDAFKTLVSTIPMVSSGNIINIKVPEAIATKNDDSTYTVTVTTPTKMVYENARRLTLIAQADNCDEGKYKYGWLYKQGIFTQGDSSDMYVRLNTGFGYSTLGQPVNVSSNAFMDSNSTTSAWTTNNLADQSYTNIDENTFSPRAIMRGNHVYIGYEYTDQYIAPDAQGYSPNNFYVMAFKDNIWRTPVNVSRVYGDQLSTLDPRFVTTATPKTQVLAQDAFNDGVLFVSFGTFNTLTGIEEDLYYTRSVKGTNEDVDYTGAVQTWEYDPAYVTGVTPAFKLANRSDVEEKEVQSLSTPDGIHLFNAWLSETLTYTSSDPHSGLDSWFGRIDYTKPVVIPQ
jgi:hypothetical protein